jgi:hypothetical protein
MTCIVGIANGGRVIFGADSAGVGGYYDKRVRSDRKVFKNGGMIFGFTSSFRMGQLLQFALTPPPIIEGQPPFEYMVKLLIPEIRAVLRTGGYLKTENGRDEGGVFLVGFRGRLFRIDGDFQVGESAECYESVGCGEGYAMGAMHALPDASPRVRLQAGLDAAAAFSAGVSKPFHFVELEAPAE